MENIDLLKFYKKRHRKKKIIALLLTAFFLILGTSFLSYQFFYKSQKLADGEGFFASLSHLITSSERNLAGGKNRVNILILGMGGEGHEGPYLTDTILLASIDKKQGKLAMLSVPRDLYLKTQKFGGQKINAINAYAELERQGSGARYTRDTMEELLRVPIDYYVRMDFDGFKKIIDIVDGVDIDVQKSFTDPLFPRFSGSGITTVTFEKGLQHMDGKTALIYARSRHGNNGEGTDFARSRRQQQIILAVKSKLLSNETLFSLSKIKDLYGVLKEHVSTNINAIEALQLAKLYKDLNLGMDKISINVIANGSDGPLYSTYINNQYVLLPKKSDWSDLRLLAANPFTAGGNTQDSAANNVSVLVLNGTDVDGLASQMAMTLSDFGYVIKNTGNAPEKDYEKSVIYELAEEKQAAISDMKAILNANVSTSIPAWLSDMIDKKNQPDFVVVVGLPA